jgi:hypothetical protein
MGGQADRPRLDRSQRPGRGARELDTGALWETTASQQRLGRHEEGHQVKQDRAGTWGTNVSTLGKLGDAAWSEVVEQGEKLRDRCCCVDGREGEGGGGAF